MLSRSKIDKNLKKYIKKHLSQGYSRHAVKTALVNHGYSESYVGGLLRKHFELQFVKKHAIVVLILFTVSIFSFNLVSSPQVTGYAAINNEESSAWILAAMFVIVLATSFLLIHNKEKSR